jgi:hypothetical protein
MRQLLALLLLVALLPACSTLPHALPPPLEANPVRDKTVHVVSHGWHTGLIVPAGMAERNPSTSLLSAGPSLVMLVFIRRIILCF